MTNYYTRAAEGNHFSRIDCNHETNGHNSVSVFFNTQA